MVVQLVSMASPHLASYSEYIGEGREIEMLAAHESAIIAFCVRCVIYSVVSNTMSLKQVRSRRRLSPIRSDDLLCPIRWRDDNFWTGSDGDGGLLPLLPWNDDDAEAKQ